jgi:hypothetical protein
LSFSSIFKSKKTIILETKEESLIGGINKIQAYKNCLFVLDAFSAGKVFIFSKEGRFISSIGRKGEGPGEYDMLYDFTIDEKNEHLFLMCNENRIMVYDLNTGKYIRMLKIKHDINMESNAIEYLGGKLYAAVYCYEEKEDAPLLIEIDPSDGNRIRTFSTIHKYNLGSHPTLITHYPFRRHGNVLSFFHPYMHTVITIDDKGVIKPMMSLKSNKLLTRADISDHPLDDLRSPLFAKLCSMDKILGIVFYFESTGMVYLTYQLKTKLYMLLYDKETGETSLFERWTDDFSYPKESGVASFFDTRYGDRDGVYNVMNGYYLPQLIDDIINDKVNPDMDKLEEIKNLPEDSNPVIFYYEYKK